jgi:hypothetical protein
MLGTEMVPEMSVISNQPTSLASEYLMNYSRRGTFRSYVSIEDFSEPLPHELDVKQCGDISLPTFREKVATPI